MIVVVIEEEEEEEEGEQDDELTFTRAEVERPVGPKIASAPFLLAISAGCNSLHIGSSKTHSSAKAPPTAPHTACAAQPRRRVRGTLS